MSPAMESGGGRGRCILRPPPDLKRRNGFLISLERAEAPPCWCGKVFRFRQRAEQVDRRPSSARACRSPGERRRMKNKGAARPPLLACVPAGIGPDKTFSGLRFGRKPRRWERMPGVTAPRRRRASRGSRRSAHPFPAAGPRGRAWLRR